MTIFRNGLWSPTTLVAWLSFT